MSGHDQYDFLFVIVQGTLLW